MATFTRRGLIKQSSLGAATAGALLAVPGLASGPSGAAADAAVALPSLRLSALRLAVAMAVSSGAQKLEAAALVSEADLDPGDLAVVRDLGPDATVFHAAPDGTLRQTLRP